MPQKHNFNYLDILYPKTRPPKSFPIYFRQILGKCDKNYYYFFLTYTRVFFLFAVTYIVCIFKCRQLCTVYLRMVTNYWQFHSLKKGGKTLCTEISCRFLRVKLGVR